MKVERVCWFVLHSIVLVKVFVNAKQAIVK